MTKIAASDRQKVADLYASGMTQAAIAAEFGVGRSRVCQILNAPVVKAAPGPSRTGEHNRKVRPAQHKAMAEMYRAGSTLAEVGVEFGISHARVLKIINALGVSKLDGGSAIRSFKNTPARVAASLAKNERQETCIRETWGMSLGDYRTHVAEHGNSAVASSPMHKYVAQRKSARLRGLEWQFTFAEWWRVWQESGKWDERGRGDGRYVMARYGDGDTPYGPETVYICTQAQNTKDSYIVLPAAARAAKRAARMQSTQQIHPGA